MKPGTLAGLVGGVLGLSLVPGLAGGAEPPKAPPQRALALDEARRTVRLMNDIYIAGVLVTHRMYAHEAGNAAAVSWGKQVIREINAKGWPQARIFGVGERLLNPENQPADAFERKAAAAFARKRPDADAGVESAVSGKYRYAVPIRVTEESCLNCHVRNKKGDLLGGVSYEALLRP